MKKFLAMLMAVMMVLSLVTVPVMAETPAANDPRLSTAPKTGTAAAPADAANLNEALNVAGGTLTFTSEGDHPWIVDGDAAKSTNVNVANSTSTVSTTVTAAAGDILQFDFMSFGEGAGDYVWDGLHLTVDGTEVMKWSRVETWTTYAVELTAGEHTVAWSYQKDGSVDREGDYATVDNVYVGAPVTPNAINVEAVSVPAGRRATVAYTVLPAEAFNKNVTFSIANTAIATVNENGVVVGVAEGTTTVTVTSVADPTVSGSATVTVTEALPTVNLEGYIAFDPEGTSGIWGGFADYDPSVIENFGTMGSTFGGAFAGGNVYGFMYNSDTNDTRFYIMNADTHQVAYPGTSAGRVVVAMAYNHAEGEMYAIAANDADGRSLYTVNLATGTLTEVAALNAGAETIMTLAIDGSGNAYGLSYAATNAVLYSINLTNGNCTAIGGTGHGLEYVQSTVWDHNTNQLFWAQYSKVETDKGQLFVIDPATGAATLCGTIGTGAEVTVLYTKNNMPVAPIEVPEYDVTFVDGLTNETIPGGYTVEAGTVLDEADFPAAPAHEGYEFTGWDYNGAPVYSDITVKARYRDPNATTATISLTAGDVFSDGSGYQMLLDADATAFGNEIPAQGPLTTGGDAPAGLYDAFEYKIPVNADGSTNTGNIVINNTVTIEVPGGVYDWCITNPTPGDRIWIASNQGNVGGRADDYEFVAGNTYNFTVYLLGQNDATDVEIIEGGGSTPNTPVPPTENPNTPEPGTTTGWGFETDPFAEGWTIRDDDGDGYNWEWMEGSGSDYNVYEGTHCMASASYQNSAFGGGTALNPDNWLISPAFTAGSTVTFWYAGQDPNYAAEPFGVYVIANGTTSDELGHFTASNTYQQGSVDISAYAGETVQVAFRHYGITDMFRLNLDLVEVSGGGSTPNTPVPPTENPNTPEPGTTTGWGFETDPFAEGWTIRDDDGDGYNWEWMEGSGSDYNVYEGTHCMASASYQNSAFGGGTALNPDNWLISPAFTAGSTVTFWYAGQDPNYAAEPFGVYVIANGTTSDELGHFTASNTYQQGSVDISDFAGQTVQVAFRHYGITDMFRLNLDLVEVSGGGSTPNTPVPPTAEPTPTQNPNTPAPGGMATISLTAGDVFGDGSGYQMLLDADATAFGNEIPVEGPLTQSGNAPAGLYDAFEYKIPVNADGSTTTSNVVVNNTVTIQVPAGTYDWCLTNPTPGDRIWIASSQGNVGGRADDYEFVAGNTYNFTVYLLGQNDATDVEIIEGGGSTPNTPVPPTENPNTPEPGTTTGWGFETDPFAEGWTIRDDDGDGYNWEWMEGSGSDYNVYEGTHCMASASYQNSAFGGGTALNPDNWLISPAFTAGSTVTFWYAGQDPNYAAEPFGVYVIANGTTSDELGHFTASNTYQQGSVDISDFAGQTVQVAFRHYDITDMFRLNLDLVEADAGGEPPVITDSPTPVITNSPTPEPPTDTPEPGDETPTPEIPTDAPTPEIPTDVPEPVTPAPGDVIFSVGGVHYVAAGSQVSVDLTINGEYEANGMNIWVQYDAEKLTLNSVDEGEIMKAIKDLGGMNILDFQSIPGSVRLGSMLPTDPVSGSGKIFTMNFTVAEGLEDGTEMPIEILVKEFFNMPVGGENTPIAFFAENGSIVVGSEPIVTDEPTAVPTDAPNPPITGAMSLIGVGIAAIVASAGVVIFRKKEED
ncbi:MAG: DUF2436 domain-containing protein [Christensenellales bacterium]